MYTQYEKIYLSNFYSIMTQINLYEEAIEKNKIAELIKNGKIHF